MYEIPKSWILTDIIEFNLKIHNQNVDTWNHLRSHGLLLH